MTNTFKRLALCLSLAALGPRSQEARAQNGPERLAEAGSQGFQDALQRLSLDSSPLVQKALAIRQQVTQANAKDLGYLCRRLRGSLPEGKCLMDDADFKDRLVKKINADKNRYAEIKNALDKARKAGGDGGSEALRSSLGKLVGTEAHPGILDNAVALLSATDTRRKGILDRDPKEMDPRYNEITVLKTLLLYSYLVSNGRDRLTKEEAKEFDGNVQLMYPAKLPANVKDLAKCAGLACETQDGDLQLGVLNAGFIYGGDFKGEVCRGVDCSAFLSRVTGAARLTTMQFEYIWRKQIAPDELSEKEKAILYEFMRDRNFTDALKKYKAVEAGPQPGDLVTWRGGGGGHVLMYVAPVGGSDKVFYGIEVNRSDDTPFEKANSSKDRSFEGFLIRTKELQQKDKKTFILRPVG